MVDPIDNSETAEQSWLKSKISRRGAMQKGAIVAGVLGLGGGATSTATAQSQTPLQVRMTYKADQIPLLVTIIATRDQHGETTAELTSVLTESTSHFDAGTLLWYATGPADLSGTIREAHLSGSIPVTRSINNSLNHLTLFPDFTFTSQEQGDKSFFNAQVSGNLTATSEYGGGDNWNAVGYYPRTASIGTPLPGGARIPPTAMDAPVDVTATGEEL